MNYQTAYNKIIEAYFKDEIQPLQPKFCFCGTLSPNSSWNIQRRYRLWYDISYPYTPHEYGLMENAFLKPLVDVPLEGDTFSFGGRTFVPSPLYEGKLFEGMCAALEVLKQIHIGRGEKIDEEIIFKKRELV